MGTGAIIILVFLATLAMYKCSNLINENDTSGVVAEALLFIINVVLLVLGNTWAWAGWQLLAISKVIFFPSEELIERMARMPPGYLGIMASVTVTLNGLIFALFQWLR